MSGRWILAPFNSEKELFSDYIDKIRLYLAYFEITDEKKKVACLIASMGKSAYHKLRTLIDHAMPETLKFEEIIELLDVYYKQKQPEDLVQEEVGVEAGAVIAVELEGENGCKIPAIPHRWAMEEFCEQDDEFLDYVERVEQYFVFQDISEEEDKAAYFLACMGVQTYRRLAKLIHPVTPDKLDYDDIVNVLDDDYNPKMPMILALNRFYKRSQRVDESVAAFAEDLERLARECKFPEDHYDDILKHQFITGQNDGEVYDAVTEDDSTTFKKALQIAVSYERRKAVKARRLQRRNNRNST